MLLICLSQFFVFYCSRSCCLWAQSKSLFEYLQLMCFIKQLSQIFTAFLVYPHLFDPLCFSPSKLRQILAPHFHCPTLAFSVELHPSRLCPKLLKCHGWKSGFPMQLTNSRQCFCLEYLSCELLTQFLLFFGERLQTF